MTKDGMHKPSADQKAWPSKDGGQGWPRNHAAAGDLLAHPTTACSTIPPCKAGMPQPPLSLTTGMEDLSQRGLICALRALLQLVSPGRKP